jgi:6-phosphogluconolactonase (cycloisomerase 2 family)
LVQLIGSPFVTDSIPLSIAIDPAGKFVYTANVNSNDISGYSINGTTGALKPISSSPFTANTDPYALIIDPSGRFLYVVNNLSNDIWAYSINQISGVLSRVGTPLSTGSGPRALTIERTGKFVYVANGDSNNISIFAINSATGGLSAVGGGPVAAGSGPTAVIGAPGSNFIYVANEFDQTIDVYAVNSGTGALTHVQNAFAGQGPTSLSIDPTNKLLFASLSGTNNSTVFSVNSSTGMLSATSTVGGRSFPIGTAMSQGFTAVTYKPQYVYVTNHNDNDVSSFKMNPTAGVLTSLGGTVATGVHPNSIVTDPFARFVFVGNTGDDTVNSYTVNSSTGALTLVNSVTIPGGAPVSLFADPSGRFVFVASQFANTIATLTVNQSTGAITLGPSSFLGSTTYPNAVTVSPSGMYLYTDATASSGTAEVFAFSIDPSTGVLSSITGSPLVLGRFETDPEGLVLDPFGQELYVTDTSSNAVSTLMSNNATGALTEIYDCSFGLCEPYLMGSGQNGPVSITVDPTNTYAYTADEGSSNITGLATNGGGLLSTLVSSPYAAGNSPFWITTDPSGKFVLIVNVGSNSITTYKLNSGTGALTSNTPIAAGAAPRYLTVTAIIK